MSIDTILPHGTPADNPLVQSSPKPEYTPSWELKTRLEMIAWLRLNADRLIKRAAKIPNQRERDRLMRLAASALETAGWYETGGAK